MKRCLPVLLILFYCHYTTAQPDIDLIQDPEFNKGIKDTAYVNRLNKLALNYYSAHPETTKHYGTLALAAANALAYDVGKADAFYTLSLIAKLKADFNAELELHSQSLKIYERLKDFSKIARTYNAIGVVYNQQEDIESAMDFFNKAYHLYEAQHDEQGMATALRRIGNVEMDAKHFSKALEYYKTSLATEKKIKNQEGIASCLNNIGLIFYEQANYDSALYNLNKSLAITLLTNNINRLPAAYHNISNVYLKQGKIKEALSYAEKDLPIAEKLGLKPAVLEATQLLYKIYDKKGDYKKALEYLYRHNEERDSIFNKENNLQYAKIQAVFKMEAKEKEIEFLRKDQQSTRLVQIIIFSSFIFAIGIFSFVVYYQGTHLKRKQEIIQKNEAIHATQQALIKLELENKHLAEKQLQHDLEFRHKELLVYTLNLVQKNALMENLREGIRDLLATSDKDSSLKLSKLIKAIDYGLETDKDWEEFRMYFEKVHSSFFSRLKAQFADLSQSDLKLCALISLNLSMKEMAELMGISPESVKMARHRLRKKLDLQTEENLQDFIAEFK
jgi:tetratricopeptide (TPR) repeat protein